MMPCVYNTVLLSTLMICSTTVFAHKNIALPYHQCSPAPTQHDVNKDYSPNYTGTIAGAVIGGVIANQLGNGRGKTLMTVAGTLLGGAVGYHYKDRHHVQPEQRVNKIPTCIQHTVHHPRQQQSDNVTYRYHGKTDHRHLGYRPSQFVPVDIKINPSARYY